MLARNASSRFGPTTPFVPALASVWHEPHLATNCCLPTIRFALSAPLTEQPEAARASAASAPRAGRAGGDGPPTVGAAARRLGCWRRNPHDGAELYPNRRGFGCTSCTQLRVRTVAARLCPADAIPSGARSASSRLFAVENRRTTRSGKVPGVDTKQRYRMRNPATGREIIIEAEPEEIYRDRESGEKLEVTGKVLPLAPSASRLPSPSTTSASARGATSWRRRT